jgi:hypothetical protein
MGHPRTRRDAYSGRGPGWISPICTEHSAFNLEAVLDLVAHAHAAKLTPIVRIADLQCEPRHSAAGLGIPEPDRAAHRSGAEVAAIVQFADLYRVPAAEKEK